MTYIVGIVEKKVVFEVSTSQYLSKNPLFKFVFKGKRGNMLTIVYKQMDGTSFMASKKIK
ncbi:MAG: thiosulfate oxidation carrier complex protein SoxZ [Campylobacterota bacterium]